MAKSDPKKSSQSPIPSTPAVGTSLAELLAAKGFVASPPPPPPAPGAPTDLTKAGKLVVRREKKGRGGKTVTLVQGLEAALNEPVCGALKRALGCGATVEEGEVVLQGDHVTRVAEWLGARGAKRISQSG